MIQIVRSELDGDLQIWLGIREIFPPIFRRHIRYDRWSSRISSR